MIFERRAAAVERVLEDVVHFGLVIQIRLDAIHFAAILGAQQHDTIVVDDHLRHESFLAELRIQTKEPYSANNCVNKLSPQWSTTDDCRRIHNELTFCKSDGLD